MQAENAPDPLHSEYYRLWLDDNIVIYKKYNTLVPARTGSRSESAYTGTVSE